MFGSKSKSDANVLVKSLLKSHSMAMSNLNKSKETTPTTTTALKVAP